MRYGRSTADLHREEAIERRRQTTRHRLGLLAVLVAAAAVSCGGESSTLDTVTPTVMQTDVTSTTVSPVVVTDVPATTPETTMMPEATTTPVPTTVVVPSGLDEWPTPPATMLLAELQRLLPAEPIVGADDAVRSDWASGDEPGFIDYTQLFTTDEISPLLLVTSNLQQFTSTPEELRTYVEVSPWETAFFGRSAPGYANLILVGPGGVVTLNGRDMTDDEVLAAAASMTRRPVGEPGWAMPELPPAMSPFYEGWEGGVASRGISWFADGNLVAELSVAAGAPSMIDPQLRGETAMITDIAGSRAIAVERPGFDGPPTSLIMWSPAPEVVVYFGILAPLDEALEIARSIREVDAVTWEASAHPPVVVRDGCNSFRC